MKRAPWFWCENNADWTELNWIAVSQYQHHEWLEMKWQLLSIRLPFFSISISLSLSLLFPAWEEKNGWNCFDSELIFEWLHVQTYHCIQWADLFSIFCPLSLSSYLFIYLYINIDNILEPFVRCSWAQWKVVRTCKMHSNWECIT